MKRNIASVVSGQKFECNDISTKAPLLYEYFYLRTERCCSVTKLGSIYDDQLIQESSYINGYPKRLSESSIIEKEVIDKAKSNDKGLELENAVVITSLHDKNYQHFLIETLSRIYVVLESFYLDCPIVLLDYPHIRETVDITFPNNDFIFIGEKDVINVMEQCYFPSFVSKNMCALSQATFESLRLFIKNVANNSDVQKCGKSHVYIGRKQSVQNAGNGRFCINEEQLQLRIADYGYSTASFDGLTLQEKSKLISNAQIVISPVGANVMNLIFAQNAERIILFTHNKAFPNPNWFVKLLKACCPKLKQVVLFDGIDIVDNDKSVNVPYKVDVLELSILLNGGC
ncbi:hypothetical protein ALT785_390008 [Alteromonas infernus]